MIREVNFGFVLIDTKHLPKPQTSNGECRKRYLYYAISINYF
jgi:hypothetical protein